MSATETTSLLNDGQQSAVADAEVAAADKALQQLRFRVPGSPAGSHPHTPWWQCVFHDPYERINVWSHALPGLVFFLIGVASYFGLAESGSWEHNPLGIFCFCATITHWCSAVTHVYPDSHSLEKLDHVGIVALIIGTPATALMAKHRGAIPVDIYYWAAAMVVSAFLGKHLRVLGFVGGSCVWASRHADLVTPLMGVQICLYLCGAVAFLGNGGHSRVSGIQDHHILHYIVTVACGIQVWLLLKTING